MTARLDDWFPGLRAVRAPPPKWFRLLTCSYTAVSITDPVSQEAVLLYFAYNARISPDQMTDVAPGAEFQFIAHLPEWGLEFPVKDADWGGGLPTVLPETGSTVWGAVFTIPDKDFVELDRLESREHREVDTVEAMDRMGKRHQVAVHLHRVNGNGHHHQPSSDYVKLMVAGSRHWSLPAGWIAGLEEHLSDGT